MRLDKTISEMKCLKTNMDRLSYVNRNKAQIVEIVAKSGKSLRDNFSQHPELLTRQIIEILEVPSIELAHSARFRTAHKNPVMHGD